MKGSATGGWFLGDNYIWVYDKNKLLHDKSWGVYVNEKENIIKGGYLVEVVSSDGKKVIWEVVYDQVIEEDNHDEIVLRGFGFSLLEEYREGFGIEGLSNYLYLLMLTKLCTEDL